MHENTDCGTLIFATRVTATIDINITTAAVVLEILRQTFHPPC